MREQMSGSKIAGGGTTSGVRLRLDARNSGDH